MHLQTLLLVAILVTLSASSAGAPADVSATLSDLMTKLQLQHAKLWFAGKLSNWGLATYEIQQIDANLEATGRFLTDPAQANPAKQLPVPNQLFVDQVAEGRSLAHSSCGTCHVVVDATKEAPALRPSAPGFINARSARMPVKRPPAGLPVEHRKTRASIACFFGGLNHVKPRLRTSI